MSIERCEIEFEVKNENKKPLEYRQKVINLIIIITPNSNYANFKADYIAVNKGGETGSYSIHQWFSMTKFQGVVNEQIQSDYFNKE